MKKLIIFIILFLLPIFSFAQEYTVANHPEDDEALNILRNGKVIHSIVPKYKTEITRGRYPGKTSIVHPIYSYLTDRASEPQPKAFDDITGDGLPNFFCMERPEWAGNDPRWTIAIRVFSISGDKVEEFEPILDVFGEVIYFDDFNKDGTFEIVGTDQERYFLYSRDGFPISHRVWIFDKKYKHYYKATTMVFDKNE